MLYPQTIKVQKLPFSSPLSRRSRRRGISFVLFALTLPVIFGMTALVVDMGNLYAKRAATQRAADAAALAGAQMWTFDPATGEATVGAKENVVAVATEYAKLNGYSVDPETQTTVVVDATPNGQQGSARVTISRLEPLFFAPVMDVLLGQTAVDKRLVKATAKAEKTVRFKQALGGNYGTTDGASNPSAFGPYARHDFGDPYSTMYYLDGTLNDGSKNLGVGADPNVRYNPDGFDYSLTLPGDYASSSVLVQLFDPDTYNIGGDSFDEIRGRTPNISETGSDITRTRFSIYKTDSNGNIIGPALASQVFGGSDSGDQQYDSATRTLNGQNPWFVPEGFNIPVDANNKNFKIRVQTIDGSSENGYNLRAGPPGSDANISETEWNNTYGDKGGADFGAIKAPIVADGKLQMNFTRTQQVTVNLGEVPKSAKDGALTISKFDTDIGSQSIVYKCVPPPSNMPATGYVGTLAGQANDRWTQDAIQLPPDYKGGRWTAEYTASKGDTSSWYMAYTGPGDGSVRLTE